ncbi:carboxymuconolactone decarboxylase family protein [Streptomyces longisporoflavus]|uniref:Carboxymuconolactone decarboxylase family protein n=1 Tax=Streptomyces longisporoflavus TaxID=28044 RepID=A0ABW7QQ61_9ACTN
MEYPDPSAVPADLREAIVAHGSLNVFWMLTHSPNLAPGVLELGDSILRRNSLPDTLRELAIVRVGHAYKAAYEIHHHEKIAQLVGLDPEALTAAETGSAGQLAGAEATVLAATDQLLERHTLDESARAELLSFLTVNQLADLVVTVGFYQLICNFLNTFEVTTEGEPPAPYDQEPPAGDAASA